MRSVDFFETHPVFRHEEFLTAHSSGGRSALTSNNLLARHLASGRLLRVRRGLYAVVPRGVDPGRATVDPYLVASHLTEDAVVAYHAALQFLGKSYSVWRRYYYLTHKRARPFSFRDLEFVPVQAPETVRSLNEWGRGVSEVPHAGGRVRVTTMERTMVDRRTGKTLPPLKWFFTGSAMRQPDPDKPYKTYGADLGGTLITLFPVTDETVFQTNLTMKDSTLLRMEINRYVLPDEGTPVTLIIEVP